MWLADPTGKAEICTVREFNSMLALSVAAIPRKIPIVSLIPVFIDFKVEKRFSSVLVGGGRKV